MAETQPPTVVEGATTGDVEDEIAELPKSAEDRKAATALSSLDTPRDDDSAVKDVDQEAVKKAMNRLTGPNSDGKKVEVKKEVKKVVKVDQADVALLVSPFIAGIASQLFVPYTIAQGHIPPSIPKSSTN